MSHRRHYWTSVILKSPSIVKWTDQEPNHKKEYSSIEDSAIDVGGYFISTLWHCEVDENSTK